MTTGDPLDKKSSLRHLLVTAACMLALLPSPVSPIPLSDVRQPFEAIIALPGYIQFIIWIAGVAPLLTANLIVWRSKEELDSPALGSNNPGFYAIPVGKIYFILLSVHLILSAVGGAVWMATGSKTISMPAFILAWLVLLLLLRASYGLDRRATLFLLPHFATGVLAIYSEMV
jgi:hypothetical protein